MAKRKKSRGNVRFFAPTCIMKLIPPQRKYTLGGYCFIADDREPECGLENHVAVIAIRHLN